MAGTFSQIYIQYVFAVQGRKNLIQKEFEEDLYRYIAGIVNGKEQKSLAVNGMPDHIHVLVGLKPAMRIPGRTVMGLSPILNQTMAK
jgi:REP element-mobilizing transposase RayT